MKSGIYLIQNNIDEKVYVGSSKDIRNRWREHKWSLRNGKHTNCHLQGAWNRDGEDSFMFLILEKCGIEDLIKREDWWIDFFDSRNSDRGYNFWSAKRHLCSQETRAKLSAAGKGRQISPETIAKIVAARMEADNYAHSKETKQKIAASVKANPTRYWVGKKREFLPDKKIKQSAALKGKPWSEARRAALDEGFRHTEEAKAKMSASRRAGIEARKNG